MRWFDRRGAIGEIRATAGAGVFEITVCDWFAAAHQLRLGDGALEPLHGHNWRVTVTLAGPRLDDMGVLADFAVVRARLAELVRTLHDRNLNELPEFAARNPSAENVAAHIADRLGDLCGGVVLRCVEIEEAPGCVARYYPPES